MLLGAGLAPLFRPRAVAGGATLAADRLLGPTGEQPVRQGCPYRIDAAVVLLAIPLFSRRSVGGAFVRVEEFGPRDGRSLLLEFGAGSEPGRARGLNRMGYIREVIRERQGDPEEAAYFGFMASSPEESFEQARRALAESGGALSPYTAIDGHLSCGRVRTSIRRMLLPARYTWADRDRMLGQVRDAFHSGEPQVSEAACPHPPMTFLYALWKLARSSDQRTSCGYSFNGEAYRLAAHKSVDVRMGRILMQRRLVNEPAGVVLLRGETVNVASRRRTPFQLWLDGSAPSPLPLRAEFQPRSYLRLSLERVPQNQAGSSGKEEA